MPVFKRGCSMCAIGIALVAAGMTSGCAKAPSVNVLGAYFPDWLCCIVAGVLLTVVVYLVLQRAQRGQWLGPSVVVYPTLVTFCSLAVWLILFQH
jgi:hypothetical protein